MLLAFPSRVFASSLAMRAAVDDFSCATAAGGAAELGVLATGAEE
jgi:hypothetical protein